MIFNQVRDTTQQKMRNILYLSLDVLERELMNENSTINVNLALKIIQNCKLKNLIEEDIGSEKPNSVEKMLFEKKFDEMF